MHNIGASLCWQKEKEHVHAGRQNLEVTLQKICVLLTQITSNSDMKIKLWSQMTSFTPHLIHRK